MEGKVLKIVLYTATLAVVVYAIASLIARGSLLQKPKTQCGRKQKANGSVWARRSVPAPPSSIAAVVAPGGWASPAYGPAPGTQGGAQ